MRDILGVIEALLHIIPEDTPCKPQLTQQLQKITSSIYFTAPEAMGYRWQELVSHVELHLAHLSHKDHPWLTTLAEVLNAEQDYRDYLPDTRLARERFIIVNGEEMGTRKRTISYKEIVRLAFPIGNPAWTSVFYSRHGAGDSLRPLSTCEQLDVEDGLYLEVTKN